MPGAAKPLAAGGTGVGAGATGGGGTAGPGGGVEGFGVAGFGVDMAVGGCVADAARPACGAAGSPSTSRSIASAVAASSRSRGSGINSPWTTGASGPAYRMTGSGDCRMFSWTSHTSCPAKGGRPSTISYSVTPSAHRSEAGVGPGDAGANSSGARYGGVPMTLPVRVTRSAPSKVAMPKSTRIARPSSRTRTLPGFTSRWTTEAAWTARRPWRICRPMVAALGTARTCWAVSRSPRDGASSSFITIQTCWSVSTWSWTVTTFWCSIFAMASASRRARCSAAAWVAAVMAFRSSRPFTATNRRNRRSWAFQTSPIPPLPIGSSSS